MNNSKPITSDYIRHNSCESEMSTFPDDSIDLVVTDPPYSLNFMGKSWDKALPSVELWKEVLRVLKPGAFAFVMSIPRQDCQAKMVSNLKEAGFDVCFSPIVWCWATGFPKAQNVGKKTDARLGMEREILDVKKHSDKFAEAKVNKIGFMAADANRKNEKCFGYGESYITTPATPEAKKLEGSYTGYQPKPCYESALICSKPLTYPVELTIITSHTITLIAEVLSWYDVGSAEKSSSLTTTQRDYIAQRLVEGKILEEAEVQIGKVGKCYGLTDTLKSIPDGTKRKNVRSASLSIDLLWKSILVDLLGQGSKFTTSMIIEQITELKTLNSLLSQVISANSTQDSATIQNGVRLNVTVVESYLISVLDRLLSLNQTGVPLSAGDNTKKEAEYGQLLAKSVGNNSRSEAGESSEVSAPSNVIKKRQESDDQQTVKLMSPVDSAAKHSDLSLSESDNQKQVSSIVAGNTTSQHNNRPETQVILVCQKPFGDKHKRSDVFRMLGYKYGYWYTQRTVVKEPEGNKKGNIQQLTSKWEAELQKIGYVLKDGDVIERSLALNPIYIDSVLINRDVDLCLWWKPYRDSDITSSVTRALATRKGITWLDDGRIPYETTADKEEQAAKNPHTVKAENDVYGDYTMCSDEWVQPPGRFAPNLLVSDDVLNDGKVTKSSGGSGEATMGGLGRKVYGEFALNVDVPSKGGYGDSGSFSRYFSLDAWAEKNLPESVNRTFPFLIIPKPSPSEKNAGLSELDEKQMYRCDNSGESLEIFGTTDGGRKPRKNHHPTVKPIQLGAYLTAIGSREGDIVYDPFCGSGSFCVSAAIMKRQYIGTEIDIEMCDIARRRIAWHLKQAAWQPDLFETQLLRGSKWRQNG